jgi:hypothetical protein
MSTDTKPGELVILEFKHMSCVPDQYVRRSRNVAETQYASIKSTLVQTLDRQGWTVNQKNFITGARSLNEKDLHDNLSYFKVPEEDIDSIRSKLVLKIFDEDAKNLKDMYSPDGHRPGRTLTPPHHLSPSLETKQYPTPKEKEKKGVHILKQEWIQTTRPRVRCWISVFPTTELGVALTLLLTDIYITLTIYISHLMTQLLIKYGNITLPTTYPSH